MKNLYVTLILVFGLQFAFGQIGFNQKYLADNDLGIDAPSVLFVSDLDGDGDLDVISGSFTDDKIVWYDNLNDQDNFGWQQVIATNQSIDNVIDVLAGDIDGDGDMDVLSASSGDGKIALYRNMDGQGDFGSQEIISIIADDVISIEVADIDGDGDLDILSRERYYLLWYENLDGLGSFGESIIITSNDFSSSGPLVASDIDNDGDIDVISKSSSGTFISWYENTNGQGDFGEHVISNTTYSSWQVSDIDNDGDIDIVASYYNSIYYFKNLDGQGDFESIQVDYLGSGIREIYLSDLDEDGLVDIIIELSDRVAWYKNVDGLGDFGEYQFITSTDDFATELVVSDADDDGDKDLFFVSRRDDRVGWYKNSNEQGAFWEFIPISFSYAGVSNDASAADLDGDGDIDIISSASDLSWYENLDGQGRFGFKRLIYTTTSGSGSLSIFAEAIDIDNDGDLDILSMTSNSGAIVWHENIDGQGNFGPQQLIDEVNNIARNVKAADFDGDGDFDVVSASWGNGTIAWYENMDGLGDFGEPQVLDAIFSKHCLPVDIDGDGDLDIVADRNYELIWLENLDGQGNFGELQLFAADLELVTDILAEDIDNDGDMDILFSTNTSGGFQIQDSISWLENLDGQGDFGEQQDIMTSLGEDSFDIADMDNDGDLDIVSSGFNSTVNFMGWFENIDGQGNFNDTRLVIDTNNSTTFVSAADIDGDGDMDVISGRFGKLSIHENLGILGNEFNGAVQLDLSAEGCNNEAPVLSNVQVTSDNGNQSFSTYTTENAGYQLPVNAGEFTTTVTSQLPDYYSVNPISYNTSFVEMGNVESLNFCIIPIGLINDLNIAIYPSINEPRPGFDTTCQLVYNNVGTTQLSGSVSFEFDDLKLQFLTASETVSSQTTNTLNFNFTDLNPFETRTIDLEFNVFAPPTTNIDDILVSTATINPVSGDETEYDNVFNLQQTVIGSYDPNDIAVLEGEQILIENADKYLHYLIRFQNTGTASAINVKVENVLDDKLDWTTMQLESLSHDGRVEIIDQTDVSFIFNNINLADSTSDEPNSHGFIAYKIKPKDDVVLGDIFFNTAEIFFDFNPPITTNTVSTEIVDVLSVTNFESNLFSVYPNPAKTTLTINSKFGFESLTIIDINGRILKTFSNINSELSKTINVEDLANGIYFLNIKSQTTEQTIKFIKN